MMPLTDAGKKFFPALAQKRAFVSHLSYTYYFILIRSVDSDPTPRP
jgi:hypothetical protein